MADRNRGNNRNNQKDSRLIVLSREDINRGNRSASKRRSSNTATERSSAGTRHTSQRSSQGRSSSRQTQLPERGTAQPRRSRQAQPPQRHTAPKLRQQTSSGRTARPQSRPAKRRTSHKKKEPFYVTILRLFVLVFDRKTDAEGETRIRKADRRVSSNATIPIIIAILFFAATIFYFGGYALTMKKDTDVPFDIVQYGTVGSVKKAEGIIIRNEKVFQSPAAGTVEYQVTEGEKVKSGTVVCTISSGEDVSKAKADLETINNKILELQNDRVTETKHAEDVKRLNSQIQTLSDEAASDFTSGDFSKVYSLKYSVEKKMDSRNQLLLSDASADSELNGQRNASLKALSEGTKAVTSDVGGIVSYYVDGMEAQLTPAGIQKLTSEQVNAKPEKTTSMKATTAASEPVFKVITSNDWYIASYLPDEYTEGWKQGSVMELYITNGVEEEEPLKVTLEVLQHTEKEAYAVFKCTEYAEKYMDMRNISFELEKPHTGIKIPTSSITQETMLVIPRYYILDGCVQKVTADGEESIPVDIVGNADKEGYVLVPMQLGKLNVKDTIRLQAGSATFTITEVVTRNGVFLVNSGVTKFTAINMENSVESEKATILDPALNPQLKENDRIVHNIEDVRENQGIYG